MKASAYLYDTISDPVSASSVSPDAAPFKRAHGKALFDLDVQRFAQGMIGLGNVTGKQMLPKVYNWDEVSADSTLCDVGSGNGHVTMALVKEFPKIKLVLQDKPVVMEQGRELWNKEHPEAVAKERVHFTPLDFLSEPPVAGCDFYYIRYVLHDWPVEQCCTILNNVRQSMKPTSRLLIHEFVLQPAFRSDKGVIEQAPEPLLANYGVGRARLYQQDLNMMILLNSKERTLQEFIQLGESCGFKFVKLWDAGEAGLLEFCLP
jgi:ubiquinone/menaquinone biosynthesis C-methylase UbiE